MSALLMLLLILIVVSIVSFGVNKHKKLRPGKFGKYGRGNKTKWILGAYGLILIISVIMLYLIPNKGFLNQNKSNEIEMPQNGNDFQDIYTAAKEHRLDETDGIYTFKKWEFPFDEKQLEIMSSNMENSNIQIMAERKSVNDNKVDVIEYATKSIIYGIDYTDKIKSPKIQLVGNELIITKPEKYSIILTSFNKEFTITQFSKGKNKQEDYFSNMGWGQRVLYLRIPQDVQLLKNKLNVQFIGGE